MQSLKKSSWPYKKRRTGCPKCGKLDCLEQCIIDMTNKKVYDTLFTMSSTTGMFIPDTFPCITFYDSTNYNNIQALNLVLPGTGQSQRIGNKIKMTKLQMKFVAYENDGSFNVLSPTACAMSLVYDRQPNYGLYPGTYGPYPETNAPPIYAYIPPNGIVTATPNITNFIDPNSIERFYPIWEKLWMLAPVTSAGLTANYEVGPTDIKSFVINEEIDLGNLETVFRLSNGDLADISTGALYLTFYTTNVDNQYFGHRITGTTRLHFIT